jgi:hypothetical protein
LVDVSSCLGVEQYHGTARMCEDVIALPSAALANPCAALIHENPHRDVVGTTGKH